jgi:hypothetical protein
MLDFINVTQRPQLFQVRQIQNVTATKRNAYLHVFVFEHGTPKYRLERTPWIRATRQIERNLHSCMHETRRHHSTVSAVSAIVVVRGMTVGNGKKHEYLYSR